MTIEEILASMNQPEGDSNLRPSRLPYVPQDWQQMPDTESLLRELMSNPESHPVEGPRRGQPRAMLVGNGYEMPGYGERTVPWSPDETYLRSPTPEEKEGAFRTPTNKEFGGIQGAEADPHTAFDLPVGPGEIGGVLKGLIGKLGIDAAIPGVAGIIRMGGKTFDNAMLHRGIGKSSELDMWADIFRRGSTTQKPASVVTPNVLQTFESKPYGLLFDVPEQSSIHWASPVDAWSGETSAASQWLDPIIDRLQKARNTRAKSATPGIDSVRRDDETMKSWIERTYKDREGALEPIYRNYYNAQRRLERIAEDRYPGKVWHPTEETPLIDPATQGLDDLFSSQLGRHADNIEGKDWLDKSFLNPRISPLLTHSEVVANLGKPNLAGVRLPLRDEPWGTHTSVAGLGTDEPTLMDNTTLARALQDFAQQMGVPIYRWPSEMTQAQQLRGLQDPFAGRWGWKSGSREYKTSTQLPQIFGIRELP